MASHYTCRACLSSLTKGLNVLPSTRRVPLNSLRSSRAVYSPSSSASRYYHASSAVAATNSSTTAQKEPVKAPQATISTRVARGVRKVAPLMTETYAAYGAAEVLLKECARHGDYTIPQANEKDAELPTNAAGVHLGVGDGWWYTTLGLEPTFNNWAHITFLHMYMLTVRFRMFPTTHAPLWNQQLINHAFFAAEDRLVMWHKVSSASLRQKWLKDLFEQWRGTLLSYDEGLVKGDAVLAAAIWRNLFGADQDIDFKRLAEIVSYMRREIRRLDVASDDEVAMGGWTFGQDPSVERPNVMLQSRLMKEGE